MAITSAICNSFKNEVLTATHNFTSSTGNSFKLALYTSSATLSASTTTHSATNEITNSTGSAYTAGGMTISAGMGDAKSAAFDTGSHSDLEKWTLGASFAF